MLGSNRQVWANNGFSQLLADSGYAVLALDMRGHGETGGSRDWDLAEEDLQMAWEWFTGLDEVAGGDTAVIGASIGSNMALITGANIPDVKTVILLSPGLDYRGVTTDDAIAAYGNRPVLIVASQEDSYAANSSETLADLAEGEAKLIMYNGAGHGTNMFGPQSDLAPALLDWLNSYLQE
jgi:pimeloyl-ACP methyl ester carboxylesterase